MASEAIGHANPGDLSLTIYTEGCGESKQELINGYCVISAMTFAMLSAYSSAGS
jgi:hypothetical protein